MDGRFLSFIIGRRGLIFLVCEMYYDVLIPADVRPTFLSAEADRSGTALMAADGNHGIID